MVVSCDNVGAEKDGQPQEDASARGDERTQQGEGRNKQGGALNVASCGTKSGTVDDTNVTTVLQQLGTNEAPPATAVSLSATMSQDKPVAAANDTLLGSVGHVQTAAVSSSGTDDGLKLSRDSAVRSGSDDGRIYGDGVGLDLSSLQNSFLGSNDHRDQAGRCFPNPGKHREQDSTAGDASLQVLEIPHPLRRQHVPPSASSYPDPAVGAKSSQDLTVGKIPEIYIISDDELDTPPTGATETDEYKLTGAIIQQLLWAVEASGATLPKLGEDTAGDIGASSSPALTNAAIPSPKSKDRESLSAWRRPGLFGVASPRASNALAAPQKATMMSNHHRQNVIRGEGVPESHPLFYADRNMAMEEDGSEFSIAPKEMGEKWGRTISSRPRGVQANTAVDIPHKSGLFGTGSKPRPKHTIPQSFHIVDRDGIPAQAHSPFAGTAANPFVLEDDEIE